MSGVGGLIAYADAALQLCMFQANVHIEKLNLAGNWMEGIGGVHIAHMLLENEYISELVGSSIIIIIIDITTIADDGTGCI